MLVDRLVMNCHSDRLAVAVAVVVDCPLDMAHTEIAFQAHKDNCSQSTPSLKIEKKIAKMRLIRSFDLRFALFYTENSWLKSNIRYTQYIIFGESFVIITR